MKTLLIPVILYTWLSLTYRDKIYHQIPNPTNKQKIHIHNLTEPTDNPINPIRDLNPKNIKLLTPNKNKYQNKY